jgi:hypothetical protein
VRYIPLSRTWKCPVAEKEWVKTAVDGSSLALWNDKDKGYWLEITRADGTSDTKKVSGPNEARKVVGNMVDGEFT